MKKAFKLSVHGETQLVDLDAPEGSLKVLQDAVGGWVEAVDLSADLTMWCNEEGKLDGSILNVKATEQFREVFGAVDAIMGDVIFTGGVDDEGDTMGLTDDQVLRLLQAAK
jgi:hypothetical protein